MTEDTSISVYEKMEARLSSLSGAAPMEEIEVIVSDLYDIALANADHTNEEGVTGDDYRDGFLYNKETNGKFAMAKGRGLYGNLGAYDDLIAGEPAYDKGLSTIVNAINSGNFEIDIHEYTDEDEMAFAKGMQEYLYASLFNPEGGWDKFVREWSEGLTYGFSIWEPVFNKKGHVQKYAFRKQNTVNKWIFSQDERDLIGIEFKLANSESYQLAAENVLIFTNEMVGNDFEGRSLARKCAPYLEIKKYLFTVYAAAIEFNGGGIKVFKASTDAGPDDSDNAKVINVLKRSTVKTNSAITIKGDEMIEYISGQGNIPVVLEMIRYCDEQILKVFSNEGALLGLNAHGSFAMASEASKASAAMAQAYGKMICGLFNGTSDYQSMIKTVIDKKFGKDENRKYPTMTFRIEASTELDQEKVNSYIQSGMPVTYDDINMFRKGLGLEPIIVDNGTQIVLGAGANIPRNDQGSFSNGQCLLDGIHTCGSEHCLEMDLANEDEDIVRLKQYWKDTEKQIGSKLFKMAKVVRNEWVNRLDSMETYPEIDTNSQDIFNRLLPAYKEEIKPIIREAVLKGGASLLKEQGVISTLPKIASQGKLGKDVSEQWVDYEASRISTQNINVLLARLEEQAVRDIASGTVKRRPEIPTESSMQTSVGQFAGRSFNFGRNEAMLEIKNEGERQGITKPLVAEYSSVLESNTCGPCKEADGVRVLVGSSKYLRMSPPNLCLGKDRCRCIWTIIMPEESGYDQILKELGEGFSKADSTLLSNESTSNSFIVNVMESIKE